MVTPQGGESLLSRAMERKYSIVGLHLYIYIYIYIYRIKNVAIPRKI
jgi:hypothetical protein